jgi:hypothetical protein
MIDRAVGVRRLVPERNDGWHVGNLGSESRPMLTSYTERLANDFELPLDGGAQADIRRRRRSMATSPRATRPHFCFAALATCA